MKLEDIRTTDLGATPPNCWWERWICGILGAKTFHWFKFVVEGEDGRWIISESISKGTALTKCAYPKFYVYRMTDVDCVDWRRLIEIHAENGELPYDWQVAFRTAIWWLFKHYLGKVLPVLKDRQVNCQEWVCLIANELGVKIIPDDQYPMCKNLEESPYLECLGEVNQ
jgi:hypothetical protein